MRHLQSQTRLLICGTRQVLLERDSPSTETMKVETKRPLMDWDPLRQTPESWHSGTKRMLLVTLYPSLLGWLPDISQYLHLLVGGGRREYSQIGQKLKLSRHRTRQK